MNRTSGIYNDVRITEHVKGGNAQLSFVMLKMHKAKKLRGSEMTQVLSSNRSNKRKGKMVDWRRNKVQQLLVRGYSQWDVAEELKQRYSISETSSPRESSKSYPTKTS